MSPEQDSPAPCQHQPSPCASLHTGDTTSVVKPHPTALPHELSTLPHGQALKRGIGKPIEPYPSIKELCSILGRNLSSEELSNHPIWENRGIKSTSVCCEPGLCCSCFGYFGTKQILVGVVLFDHCLVLSHLVSPFTGELEPKSGSREAAQESGF